MEIDLVKLIDDLTKSSRKVKTSDFLKKMKTELLQFGSISENKMKVIYSIARETGVVLKTGFSEKQKQDCIELVKGSCGVCEDGLVFTRDSVFKALYSWLCSCEIGKKRPEKYPIWRNQSGHRLDNVS